MLTKNSLFKTKMRALSSQGSEKEGIFQVLVTLDIFGHFKNVQFRKYFLEYEKNSDCD